MQNTANIFICGYRMPLDHEDLRAPLTRRKLWLDDHIIQGLKAADKPKKYADGGGLFLFIPASGKKLWRLAYRFERKAKLLSFGEYPQVSLRAARQRRDEAKALLRDGIDPANTGRPRGHLPPTLRSNPWLWNGTNGKPFTVKTAIAPS